MWLFTFTAARTALTYITLGALTVIWAGVWYIYLFNNPPATQTAYYWCSGFLLTGLTLAVIGLAMSLINRSPQLAAAVPVAATNPPADVAVLNGQAVATASGQLDMKENRLQDVGGQG